MTSAPASAPPAQHEEADADLADARVALARRLGSIINTLADRDDVLLTMVWDSAPTADAAWFDPRLIKVTVNGAVALKDGIHPDQVDPLSISGRLRHPVIVGMSAHEAAHARSTRWGDWDTSAGRAVIRAAVLLEEPRIESRHLQERPGDRVFLRACASNIVLPAQRTASPLYDRWRAAAGAALILGRVDAGVLTRAEAQPVSTAVEAVLGTDDLGALRALWQEVLTLDDGDQDGLLDVARRWVEVIGADADEDLPGVGCAAGEPRAEAPTDDADSSDVIGAAVVAVAVAASVQAQISTGALPDPEQERQAEEDAARRQRERRAEAAAQQAAQQAARRVFTPAPAPSSRRSRPRNPVSGRRAPTPVERAAARRLGAALAKARFREPARVRVASALPPGRLSGRDAMLGAAQRTLGMPVTARPFRSKTRTHSQEPPVAVGVAVDVSGSMRAYTPIIASTAWMFAHGTREVAGKAATVAFGTAVTPIVSPGQPPSQVTEFHANDGNHRFTEATNALDGALNLSRHDGARVLVIVSDGHWEPEERIGGERLVRRLIRAGVHVLWFCLDPGSDVLPGAHRVDITQVSDIPAALSNALVSALRQA
ncbi:VWA domain-containing protein [Streptomyces sp. NBC_01142]|uniref:VWA domain-containing protein n=1 Tax=Streptomyces sp. NBC_01142 TaxID=2975865 RepID=UPI002256D58C|nr:VWA domain-containing protein [Streptomyces sp. NBC_01142]MCX4826759.1 VWA domain-containing protein [Streptomyces sp. NBC_01142]